jgi:tetratricopeptide (TPR) repeat protein
MVRGDEVNKTREPALMHFLCRAAGAWATSLLLAFSLCQLEARCKSSTGGFISASQLHPRELSEEVSSHWQRLNKAGQADLNARKYDRAESELLAAIREARQMGGNSQEMALSRNTLGYVYLAQEKYREAEQLFTWSLSVLHKDADQLEAAKSLNGQAIVALHAESWAKAAKLAREALAIRQRALGEEHHDVGQTLCVLATALARLGDQQEAEKMFESALKILEGDPGLRRLDLADALRDAALYYQSTAQRQTSNDLFERSYLIKDKAARFAEPATVSGQVNFYWEDGSPRSLEFPDYDVPLRYLNTSGVRVAAAVVDLWELMGVLITITNVSDHRVDVAVTTAYLSETKPGHAPLEMVDPTRIDRTRRELQIWDITYKRPWLANIQKTRTNRGFVPAHGHDLWRGPNEFGLYGAWGSAPKVLPEKLSLELSPEQLQDQAAEPLDTSMVHSADANFQGMTTVSLEPFESRTGVLFFMNPRSLEVSLKVPVGNVMFKFPFKCRKRRISQSVYFPDLALAASRNKLR